MSDINENLGNFDVKEILELSRLVEEIGTVKKKVRKPRNIEFPHAKVVVAKCANVKKLYGMRLEEIDKDEWLIDWAFPLSEKAVSFEQYASDKITGKFEVCEGFPGCPYCGGEIFFRCGKCHNLTCMRAKERACVCAHCNKESHIAGKLAQLNTGGDR